MRSFSGFLVLLLGLSCLAALAADPPRHQIAMTMFAVPEALWQADFEGQFKESAALWLKLNRQLGNGGFERPLNFEAALTGAEPLLKRDGKEVEFTEGWSAADPDTPTLTPIKKTKRFIGTTVELTRQDAGNPEQAFCLKIHLEHHVAQPVMQRINFANAALGAEREKLSVEYPQFEKIEWQGEVFVWQEWRLVTSLLRPQREGSDAAPAMRYLVFIKRL